MTRRSILKGNHPRFISLQKLPPFDAGIELSPPVLRPQDDAGPQ